MNSPTKNPVYQRKNHSKERTMRTLAVVEKAQALISDDSEQSLRVLMNVVKLHFHGWKLWRPENLYIRPYIFQQNSSYESFDSKFALRQRYVLVQGILASQQSRFKSLRLLWSVMERVTNKSRHPNVMLLRTAIEAAFMDSATLQRACERFRPRKRPS